MVLKSNCCKVYLQALIEWLEKRGLKVNLSNSSQSYYFYHLNEIVLNSSKNDKYMLYDLLHEAGHWLLFNSKEFLKFKSGFYKTLFEKPSYSLHYRIDRLQEEYIAWDHAYKLACNLKFNINERSFFNYRNKCIRSHLIFLFKKNLF